jgi:Fe-S-cluster containining protein
MALRGKPSIRKTSTTQTWLPKADQQLVQIVDAALANAAAKSGPWLACRPGCTQCCVGPFAISQLDAARLRRGWEALQESDARRAQDVRRRAQESVARLAKTFPGDPATGLLSEEEDAEARFEEFADDEVCPALDPATGTCDLYAARPMTCRTFGPPVRSGEEGGLGVCELCYHGATDDDIARCEMIPDPDDLESRVLHQFEKKTQQRGNTIVAYCLAK